ncbi:hypothetical protein G7Y89_g6573 [Cudoniella acicularis]|uniref:Uncharacterized protein n=1 Tax=Cudoniella acicularis TaxID=354080 RepID=A0A8H4RLP4_9HELO|nr:hypothetical protein G7Y89_g6573 [Cudoniella acicularis]
MPLHSPVRAPQHILDLLSQLHHQSLEQEAAINPKGKFTSTDNIGDAEDKQPAFARPDFDDLMRDKFIALDEDKCHFVYQLIGATGATNIVEAGTSFGPEKNDLQGLAASRWAPENCSEEKSQADSNAETMTASFQRSSISQTSVNSKGNGKGPEDNSNPSDPNRNINIMTPITTRSFEEDRLSFLSKKFPSPENLLTYTQAEQRASPSSSLAGMNYGGLGASRWAGVSDGGQNNRGPDRGDLGLLYSRPITRGYGTDFPTQQQSNQGGRGRGDLGLLYSSPVTRGDGTDIPSPQQPQPANNQRGRGRGGQPTAAAQSTGSQRQLTPMPRTFGYSGLGDPTLLTQGRPSDP